MHNEELVELKTELFDTPKINIEILGLSLDALLDSGATASVCSESLYMKLRELDKKIVTIRSSGLFCSTAVSRKKQRIKYQ